MKGIKVRYETTCHFFKQSMKSPCCTLTTITIFIRIFIPVLVSLLLLLLLLLFSLLLLLIPLVCLQVGERDRAMQVALEARELTKGWDPDGASGSWVQGHGLWSLLGDMGTAWGLWKGKIRDYIRFFVGSIWVFQASGLDDLGSFQLLQTGAEGLHKLLEPEWWVSFDYFLAVQDHKTPILTK